ncbi:PQQ-binding-like beta-propeller repeat protein [Chloroflexota bacterium]
MESSTDSTSEQKLWVICPVCHKANTAGTRYCEHCWGAVIHPEIPLTSEEVEEAQRRREAYLKRRKIIKIVSIGIGSLMLLLGIYILLYFTTDTVSSPPQNVNSNSAPGEWAMFQHDLARSGSYDSTAFSPKGTLKWVFSTDAPIHSSPAVADGIVYVGSQDFNLYAVDADTGTKNWEYKTNSWVESSPAVVNDTVYFGSNDSWIFALDAKSGEKTWEFKTGFPVKSAPAIADGVVYFGSDDYFLYALDAAIGKELWSFNIGSPAWSFPAVSEGIVYIGSSNGYAYALNSQNGQRRLRFKSHYALYSAPVIKDGIVYVITTNGFLYAFEGDARTKYREHEIRPLWSQLYIMGVPGVPKPPIQTGLVWMKRLGGPATSSPTIAGNTYYVGLENKLVAIDIESHELLWEFETEGNIRSSPAVAGSTVVFGSEDGLIYALDTASGEKLWDYPTGDKITSSPAVANGVIYIGSHDGNLYAIE